jgi:hypothetical protein
MYKISQWILLKNYILYPGQLYLMLNSHFELHNEFENLPIKSENAY